MCDESKLIKAGYRVSQLPNGNYVVSDPLDGPDGYRLELSDKQELLREACDHLFQDW